MPPQLPVLTLRVWPTSAPAGAVIRGGELARGTPVFAPQVFLAGDAADAGDAGGWCGMASYTPFMFHVKLELSPELFIGLKRSKEVAGGAGARRHAYASS